MEASGAHLHLGDLAIHDYAGDLKIRLPRPTRPVVRVRDVVAEGDALVADEAAISLDLCHELTLRRDELDARHLGAVTLALAGLENAGVTALSRRELRSDFLEQLVGGRAVRDMASGEPAVVQRSSLGLGDQLLDEWAKLFRLRHAPHESELLLARAAKLLPFLTVTHLLHFLFVVSANGGDVTVGRRALI